MIRGFLAGGSLTRREKIDRAVSFVRSRSCGLFRPSGDAPGMSFGVAAFTRRMGQRNWLVTGFMGLCAVACGGRAQDAEVGTPPSGFYSVSGASDFDSCQQPSPQGAANDLVSVNAEGPNVRLWPGDLRRQDITWKQPLMHTWSECGATLVLDVKAKTAHSFALDYQMDWVNPTSCDFLAPLGIPPSDCTVHVVETYELEQACPAERNNVGCQ
jgi:hypothetical protein